VIGRALEWLAERAAPALAVGVGAGLVLQPLAALLRPALVPAILVPLVVALVRLDWRLLADHGRRPLPVALATAWILVASPTLVWAALPAGLPAALHTGLVLMAAAPPIMASAALALLLGLDMALVVVVLVVATAATPVTLPAMALWLLDLDVDIGAAAFTGRLAAFVGGAFVVAWAVRRFAPAAMLTRHARRLDGAAVVALLVFALAIMDGVTAVVVARPGYVLVTLVAAFTANLGLQALTSAVFIGLGRRRAVSIGLMAGNCNMGLVLAVLGDAAEPDLVVFFAMAQLPIYTLPALLQPLYRRLASGQRRSGLPPPPDAL